MVRSAAMKNSDAKATMIKTINVVIQTSFGVGHTTFATSWRTSSTNFNGFMAIGPASLWSNRDCTYPHHGRTTP